MSSPNLTHNSKAEWKKDWSLKLKQARLLWPPGHVPLGLQHPNILESRQFPYLRRQPCKGVCSMAPMRLSALKAWLCLSLGCAWAGGWMNLLNLYLKNRKVHWKAPTPQNILEKTKHMTHCSTWLGVPKTFGDCPCSFVLRAYFHLWTGLASPECPSSWAMLYTFSTKGKEILMDECWTSGRSHLPGSNVKNPHRLSAIAGSLASGALNSHHWKSPGRISMHCFGDFLSLCFEFVLVPILNNKLEALKRESHSLLRKGERILKLAVTYQSLTWTKSELFNFINSNQHHVAGNCLSGCLSFCLFVWLVWFMKLFNQKVCSKWA